MKKEQMDFLGNSLTKVAAIIISGIITLITFYIKQEISEVARTLRSIQVDVQRVSSDNLLLNQKLDLRMETLESNFNLRLDSMESKIMMLHGE